MSTSILEFPVTAIIPVFNGESFIGRAIRSVQSQACPATVIRVVDDCSTDKTMSVLQEFAAADSRIHITRNATNSGPSHSRNQALRECETPFAAFLDADDEWLPNHLSFVGGCFQTQAHAAVVYGDVQDRGADVLVKSPVVGGNVWANPLLQLLDLNPIPQSAAALNVAKAMALGGYDAGARYAEDYDLWIRFALSGGTFVGTGCVSALRTRHQQQVSARNQPGMYRSAWRIRRAAVERHAGSLASVDQSVWQTLVRSQARDIDAALNARRKDLVQLMLEVTDWLPGQHARAEAARKVIGWRWPFWRAAAFAYDAMPKQWRHWLKQRLKPHTGTAQPQTY